MIALMSGAERVLSFLAKRFDPARDRLRIAEGAEVQLQFTRFYPGGAYDVLVIGADANRVTLERDGREVKPRLKRLQMPSPDC